MKRLISLILGVVILLSSLSGCYTKTIENSEYVVAYDRIMFELESTLDEQVYRNLTGYFAMESFNDIYGHQDQVTYMKTLVGVLDNTLYELNQIGHKTNDEDIQFYQSNVEYALKDIRSQINNLLKLEVIESIMPNKNTLYRDVYRFMVGMNKAMLKYVENEMLLDKHLAQYREGSSLSEELSILKDKNRMRYLYAFMMTSTYIAPMQDYTGLHVYPARPWELRYIDVHHVYELSFAILIDFREFYVDYMQLLSQLPKERRSEEMIYFFEQVELTVGAYESYYNIRKTYPDDFYKSKDFESYQEAMGNRRIGYFNDFTEDYPDLIESGEAYMLIRRMLFDERLQNMMYDEKDIN